ncbi:MAG: hypothetical protein EZS28_034897 [Streblomastix strix]|uniref:Uncharacterized protein n=1 Tax=Streblomastix strix TaxID=222440 RepID=A0A5J4UJ15_9EUKA|nr:MAG: hypothetical protein EZS28_034897 [Streblomastix strix]
MLLIVLLTAVLSFGNDTLLQSAQSAPTISSLSQIQDLLSQTGSPNQNSNLPCRSFVSQTYPVAYSQVAEALEVPCASDEGYEIVLLDSEHTEYLKIDQNSSIIIKNAYTNPTVWQINTTKEEIIQLNTGNLTLINFEFRFIILSNGSISTIYPIFYDADYDFGESVEGSFNLMKFKDYLSAGAIAGIVVGSLVFVSIVAGVIIFLLVLHKKKRQSQYNSLEQMDKFLRARKEKEYI